MPAPSLDGRRFVMSSSTNSVVDPASPSRFRYRQREGVVWGEYDGDTVVLGRFVGVREGDELTVSFVHALVDGGAVVHGTGSSTVEVEAAGLRLVERFTLDGVEHTSICIEEQPDAAG